MPDETDAEVEAMVRREVARALPDELYLGRALLRVIDAERAKVTMPLDELDKIMAFLLGLPHRDAIIHADRLNTHLGRSARRRAARANQPEQETR